MLRRLRSFAAKNAQLYAAFQFLGKFAHNRRFESDFVQLETRWQRFSFFYALVDSAHMQVVRTPQPRV